MIKTYEENGKIFWLVYVNIRSKLSTKRKQRKVKGIESGSEAKKIEQLLLREAERELAKEETLGSTWGQVIAEFERYIHNDYHSRLQTTTRLDYVAAIHKHTQSWWNRMAADITRVDARELFQELTLKGLSTGHQKKIKIILHKVFMFGIETGQIKGIGQSPVFGYQFPKEEEKKPEILTIQEIRHLLRAARELSHAWFPVWSMALLTGMRNGELFALKWSDVDFENKTISLTKSYNTRTRSIKSTKSGYWRTIPVSSELERLLKELRLQSNGRPELLPRLANWEKGGQARVLREFCQGVGIPSIKFHTLRACFATQLIRQGIPPIQIQKICGWRDLETMQRYIRLAGIEVTGATEGLKVLPEVEILAKVVNLFETQP